MKKKKKPLKISWKAQIFVIMAVLMGILFLPSTALLVCGMIPTFVALFVYNPIRAMTVGFANFAGCFPFWLELVSSGHSLEVAFQILQPNVIVVMYSAAGIGYLIDWAMMGLVSSVLVRRAEGRLRSIEKRQKILIERWGKEVTGDLPLDQEGFPINTGDPEDLIEN